MTSFVCRVTQEDIRKGVKNDPELCPIAHALMNRGLSHVCINGAMAKFSYEEERWEAVLSDEAREFVVRYDGGRGVWPFDFQVQPQPVRI